MQNLQACEQDHCSCLMNMLGLGFSVSKSVVGIAVLINGYNDKQKDLMESIFTALATFHNSKFLTERFEMYKQRVFPF